MLLKGHASVCVPLGLFLLLTTAMVDVCGKRHKRSVLSECQVDTNNVTFGLLLDCVRDKSLLYLDRMTAADTIELMGSGALKLVRRNDASSINKSSLLEDTIISNSFQGMPNSTWAVHVLNKLTGLLKSHVLQIDVIRPQQSKDVGVHRGRRRRNQMMLPMMMFGLIAIGMVLVPMGFQFLSMFAGKAVLLSKIALLLASINGMKRFANSGINYGFYQATEGPQLSHHHQMPPLFPPHPRPGWERSDYPRGA